MMGVNIFLDSWCDDLDGCCGWSFRYFSLAIGGGIAGCFVFGLHISLDLLGDIIGLSSVGFSIALQLALVSLAMRPSCLNLLQLPSVNATFGFR